MGALEGSQAVMWVILEAAGRILEPLEELLEGSWEPLGRVLGVLLSDLSHVLILFWRLGSVFEAIC